jgi:riboflavin synthase
MVFTGIVEERGRIASIHGATMVVEADTVGADAALGSSVAVSGVCLTVVANDPATDGDGRLLSFDVAPETKTRTTFGDVTAGRRVNLERPVTLLTRLGGHLVQGHVDGVGAVRDVRPAGDGREITFGLPHGAERYVVEKGSIAVDGVSLTVTGVGDDWFGVALIPHTLEVTTLGALDRGDRVNLEVDLMAKYVERLMGRDR